MISIRISSILLSNNEVSLINNLMILRKSLNCCYLLTSHSYSMLMISCNAHSYLLDIHDYHDLLKSPYNLCLLSVLIFHSIQYLLLSLPVSMLIHFNIHRFKRYPLYIIIPSTSLFTLHFWFKPITIKRSPLLFLINTSNINIIMV